jgi:signal transduction histidine kinase
MLEDEDQKDRCERRMTTTTLVTNVEQRLDDPPQITPERIQTDASLRAERTNADAALAEKRSADEAADEVVTSARTKADDVLDHAREKADAKLGAIGSAVSALHDVVEKERALEDAVLEQERAAADARLRQERERQAALLESVLLVERSKTDRYLLTERDRSDDAIASRDDFLGMVSHDLRNHLHGIGLEAALSQRQAADSAEGQRNAGVMERIQRHAKHMARIVEDLIDVVGIDAGKLVMRPESADASVLLAEAEAAFATSAAESGITLGIERSAQRLEACFDAPRMMQVLSNFLSNAIKFTPAGGSVTLRGERDDQELRLIVSDSGPGIPAHMLAAIFERFWQVGKNDQRGLGLGLYISRCIVEGHQGAIRVESTIGKGSSFIAAIPCSLLTQ